MILEGSVVNQIEISGFKNLVEAEKFRKKIKSMKSVFNISKIDKHIEFQAEEASYKIKDDHSLVYLFLTENSYPEHELCDLSGIMKNLSINHLIIAPSGEGVLIFFRYEMGQIIEKTEMKGSVAHMLGDLIQGGFK
jgi:hypothetical protein